MKRNGMEVRRGWSGRMSRRVMGVAVALLVGALPQIGSARAEIPVEISSTVWSVHAAGMLDAATPQVGMELPFFGDA